MKRMSVAVYGYLLVLVIGFQSCAGLHPRDYGRFLPDQKVADSLDLYQVNPRMNYYISGSDVYPNALLGLDKNYILDTSLWKGVDTTPYRLKEIVTGMHDRAYMVGQDLFGFTLLDLQGKPVGIWYSILSATTSIRFKEDNHVVVYTPDQDTYTKFEDHGRDGKR